MKIEVKNKQTFTPIEVKFTIDDPELYKQLTRAWEEGERESVYATSSEWFNSDEHDCLETFLNKLISEIVK